MVKQLIKKTSRVVLSMKDLVEQAKTDLIPIKAGEMTNVKIIKVGRSKILVDVAGLNTGIIPEKEFSSDILDLKEGDTIPAFVLLVENENGQVILSLKRASKERYWKILNESYSEGTSIKIRVKQANRGGLIVEFGNIEGFLPVSQLTSNHYPRVGDQKDKILEHLKKLINTSLQVKVITLEPGKSKVIFSEKEAGDQALDEKLKQYKIGQQLTGVITGIVNFGIFVNLSDIEGLVHISEVSWDKVENIEKLFKVGDKVKVEIIDISNGRISLSIKRLKSDPWLDLVKNYKVGQKVEGSVTKITPYGAFVKIDGKVNAMFHISELNTIFGKKLKNLSDLLEVGKKYEFVINSIEKKSRKIGLSWSIKVKPQGRKSVAPSASGFRGETLYHPASGGTGTGVKAKKESKAKAKNTKSKKK